MKSRVVKILVCNEGDPIFAEGNYSVEVRDEAAGEYLAVEAYDSEDEGLITIDKKDWPALREVIDRMFEEVAI
jgi:hypothetical protein